jgi:hypothetical protein
MQQKITDTDVKRYVEEGLWKVLNARLIEFIEGNL